MKQFKRDDYVQVEGVQGIPDKSICLFSKYIDDETAEVFLIKDTDERTGQVVGGCGNVPVSCLR